MNFKENWVIVGLGNPGEKYRYTRHNVGFMFLDTLSSDFKKKDNYLYSKINIGKEGLILVKPQTFMNLSGYAVLNVMKFYKLSLDKLIVIFDDISFSVGKIRLREKGSHGGHNGLKNIFDLLGTNKVKRIKVGVGNKPHNWNLDDWVLSNFSKYDFEILELIFNKISDSINLIVQNKFDDAMNKFNRILF
ncbi:MAG: aminoacyl-tRNA hydrolase [Firmicutes bacterium]|nr:aminoacyl-tRNA hydrolase [Bacillota bacterium]